MVHSKTYDLVFEDGPEGRLILTTPAAQMLSSAAQSHSSLAQTLGDRKAVVHLSRSGGMI